MAGSGKSHGRSCGLLGWGRHGVAGTVAVALNSKLGRESFRFRSADYHPHPLHTHLNTFGVFLTTRLDARLACCLVSVEHPLAYCICRALIMANHALDDGTD